MPRDPEDLINQLVVNLAGMECLRDFLLAELGRLLPEDQKEAFEDRLRAEASWKWNEEAYPRARSVYLRFGLEPGEQLDEHALRKSPLIPEGW